VTSPRSVVVDASIAVKWFMPEVDSREARALLQRSEASGLELLAPEFILIEAANVLRTRHRRGEVTAADAQSSIAELPSAFARVTADAPLIESALGLALDLPVSVYDALYVALARVEGCPLVTADARLAGNVPPSVAAVVLLRDFSV
jgi:predicted nucleic acid-binding protein